MSHAAILDNMVSGGKNIYWKVLFLTLQPMPIFRAAFSALSFVALQWLEEVSWERISHHSWENMHLQQFWFLKLDVVASLRQWTEHIMILILVADF